MIPYFGLDFRSRLCKNPILIIIQIRKEFFSNFGDSYLTVTFVICYYEILRLI